MLRKSQRGLSLQLQRVRAPEHTVLALSEHAPSFRSRSTRELRKPTAGRGSRQWKSTRNGSASARSGPVASVVNSESFEIEAHYYPRVLNAQRHPLITSFMGLSNKTIAQRYCHLHPEADYSSLLRLLSEPTKHFMWAGADLFAVTDNSGKKQMIVVETNSCPSGNKSLPLPSDEGVDHDSNYHKLIVRSFGRVSAKFPNRRAPLPSSTTKITWKPLATLLRWPISREKCVPCRMEGRRKRSALQNYRRQAFRSSVGHGDQEPFNQSD